MIEQYDLALTLICKTAATLMLVSAGVFVFGVAVRLGYHAIREEVAEWKRNRRYDK